MEKVRIRRQKIRENLIKIRLENLKAERNGESERESEIPVKTRKRTLDREMFYRKMDEKLST